MRSYACWIATLWHDTHSVWFSFLFWAHLIISLKLCRFCFIWQIVFFPVSVFLVSQWCICSKSLVGHRWSLRWFSLIFVWLQCDMRSSACWIATLWLDSHSFWDSSAFRARFFGVMVLCHSRFVWRVCIPSCGFGITVVRSFEILGWSALMFDMMFGNFRLTAVLNAVIYLLDRNTVAWYPFSLIFLPFLSWFNTFFETLPVLFYLTIFFLSPCSWYHSGVFVRNPWFGHRWCLRWCSLIFVWLQCDMRSSACWIATLWLDSHSVWDSSAFKECFLSFFGSMSVIGCLTCLSLNWSPCSWYYSGTLFRDRGTVAW